jgi:fructose-1,6-bisphosphatase/inositol monophosphatase family enzyme
MVDCYLNYRDCAATELLVDEAGGKFTITGSKKLADGRTAYNMICGKPRVVDWLLNEVFG